MAGSEYYDDDRYAYRVGPNCSTSGVDLEPSSLKVRIHKMNTMGLNPSDADDVALFLEMQELIAEQQAYKKVSLDPNVQSVIDKYEERARVGFEKYGTDTTRTDIDLQGWLTHLQEELMDATIYIERLKNDI